MSIQDSTSIQIQHACHCHEAGCKPSFKGLLNGERFLEAMEKVCAIAIGIFSAAVSPLLFVGSFLTGVALGVVYQGSLKLPDGAHGHAVSSCSRGFMEGVAGVRMPPLVSLAANVGVMAAHVQHHPQVFVPISGIILGIWAGTAGVDLYPRKVAEMKANIGSMAARFA